VTVHLGALELSAKAIIGRFGKENLKKATCSYTTTRSQAVPICRTSTCLPPYIIAANWSPIQYPGTSRRHRRHAPGQLRGDTVSIFQEGVRLPPIKLYDQGVLNEGVRDLFLANVRVPLFSWATCRHRRPGADW